MSIRFTRKVLTTRTGDGLCMTNAKFTSIDQYRDVEIKNSRDDTVIARTGIAVDRRFSKNKEADFFNLVAFGKTAEMMNKWLEKGRRILVEGRLRFSQFDDKDGKKQSAVDVIVENVEFADDKKKAASDDPFGGTPVDEEDTPF